MYLEEKKDIGDKTTSIDAYSVNNLGSFYDFHALWAEWKYTHEWDYHEWAISDILSDSCDRNYRYNVYDDDCIVRWQHSIQWNNGEWRWFDFIIDFNYTRDTATKFDWFFDDGIDGFYNYNGDLINAKYCHISYMYNRDGYVHNWIFTYAPNTSFNSIMSMAGGIINVRLGDSRPFCMAIFQYYEKAYCSFTFFTDVNHAMGNYMFIFPCNQTKYTYAESATEIRNLQKFGLYSYKHNPPNYGTNIAAEMRGEYTVRYSSINPTNLITSNECINSDYQINKIPNILWNNTYVKHITIKGLALIKSCKFEKLKVYPIPGRIYTIDTLTINNTSSTERNAFSSININVNDINNNNWPYDRKKYYDYGDFDEKLITKSSNIFNGWKLLFNTILSTAEIKQIGEEWVVEDSPTATTINRLKISREYGENILSTVITIYPGSLINSRIQTTKIKISLNNLLSNNINYTTIDRGTNMIYINGNQNISYNNNEYGVICINTNAEQDDTTEYMNIDYFNEHELATIAFDQFETTIKSGTKLGPGQYNANEFMTLEGEQTVEFKQNEVHFPLGTICNFDGNSGEKIKYKEGTSNQKQLELDTSTGNPVNVVANGYCGKIAWIQYDVNKYKLFYDGSGRGLNLSNECYVNGRNYDYWSKFMVSKTDENKFTLNYLTEYIGTNGTTIILISTPIIPKNSVILKGSIINDKLVDEDKYAEDTIIIDNFTVILKGSIISDDMYYLGTTDNKYKGFTSKPGEMIPDDIIIPAYLTAASKAVSNGDEGYKTEYPKLGAGSKIKTSDLINLKEYTIMNFDVPNLTTNNIMFNYHFYNTRTNAFKLEDGHKLPVSIQEAVETSLYPKYNININFEIAMSVNDLKLIGKRIENTNQYFISLYPKCKVYYPGLAHIEELNCVNKLEPINLVVELTDINDAIITHDYPFNGSEEISEKYEFDSSNQVIQFYTSDYAKMNNNVLSDFMSCCGFAYVLSPKYDDISKSTLKTELTSNPFQNELHKLTDENTSEYKYNLISSKIGVRVPNKPIENNEITVYADDNVSEIKYPLSQVEYYNDTNALIHLGTYTSSLSSSIITDDTTQICFKFYVDNNGLEFLRVKMNLCDFYCCNDMFGIISTTTNIKYYLHVQSLKKYIDYYLNGEIIHDRSNHTEIYAYYSGETTGKKEFYLHNAEKYYYVKSDDYSSEDFQNMSNYHIIANSEANNKYSENVTIGTTDIDESKITEDLINESRELYVPKKISSYEMICELFDKYTNGYFKVDILHQYYDNKATNGLYYDSVITYATTPTYFQYINYELNSQNIRQYVSYPNANPIDERIAFMRIDNTNYESTTENKFNYKDCENCVIGCCDFGINPINDTSINNKYYKGGNLTASPGSLNIYRGNLKITAIYITTMLPLYKDEDNNYSNVDLNYGVINYVDDKTGKILQTTTYTCDNVSLSLYKDEDNNLGKEYKVKLVCKSGDIEETYEQTAQLTYVNKKEGSSIIIPAKSFITANSKINGELYISDTVLDDDIEVIVDTKLAPNSYIYENGKYVPAESPQFNFDVEAIYPDSRVMIFNGENCVDRNVVFNYVPNKCYVTFSIPILVDSHEFDYINHFKVMIDKILCTYDLLSFDITQMPDEYRKSDVFITDETTMNYENVNLNNTYITVGSTIGKGSVLNEISGAKTFDEDITIHNVLKMPLRLTKGSVINSERIQSLVLSDDYLDYEHSIGENSLLAIGSVFIIDASNTNMNILNKQGLILYPNYDTYPDKNYYVCQINIAVYKTNTRIEMAPKSSAPVEGGNENPIYNLGPEDDYIFTENSRLVSTVLGFNVYQRTYLYNSITGHFETEIELDTNKINKIVKGSCVGNGSQLNYTIYNKGTDSSIPPNTNVISDTMNITNKITIPPESILAEGSILMPGSMINGKEIEDSGDGEGTVLNENIEIVKVSEDANYYLDTIYVDTDKYNTVEDLVKALNDNFRNDIYNNLNKYDDDVVFKNIVYINYDTPRLLSLYDSDDNLYNIIIDWDSWDFRNMTASLTSGKKIYIYAIKNDGKSTVSRVVTVVSLDSKDGEEPEPIKFDFSDVERSTWDLIQYEQTTNFIYSYRYKTAIPIQFKDVYDDEIINDELIDDTIVKNNPFIEVSKVGEQYTYKFATEIIPVEFTEDDIPNEMNYLNLVRKFQNYEKYIDENADKMLVYPVIEKITNNYMTDKNLTNYIKDYINAEKYFINFKQNQRSLWHKLGISPILIDKENRPIIKVDQDSETNIYGSNNDSMSNLNYILENDLYDSFSEIVYYHYLGSYFTETVYNSDWIKFSHRFIHNRNNLPTGSVDIYEKNQEVEDGIKRFDLWNNIWRNDRKPDLDVPLTFMLKLSQYEDVEKVLNLASNNNNVIYSIDEDNIRIDRNNDLVLSIHKTIELKTSEPFYIYLDAKTHYPFERGVNATLSIDFNKNN